MHHLKRLSLLLLSIVLTIAVICPASAASEKNPRSSLYLDNYSAYLMTGNRSGAVDIDYYVEGTNITSDYVGVSKIDIYKSNGSLATTIRGNTSNGLLAQNAGYNAGTYTYQGVSGVTYYAVLTMYAAKGSGADSKAYTTNSVTAP